VWLRSPHLDLSSVLIGQLGLATEYLNRCWYELNSSHRIFDIQRHAVHRTMPWMAATLGGLVKETGAVFEAKFTLSSSFSEEAAAEKHMAQLQHDMLVAGTKKCVLSIIDDGGKWISCRSRPTRSTRLFWLPPKSPSGGASRPVSPRLCSIASLRNHGSKQSVWPTSSPTKRGN
jgi:hypothetical protein